ncbi:MAG: hypothetical protein ACI4VF_03395 [Lachnospirales bacterium]
MKVYTPENIIQYKLKNVKCNCCGKEIEKDSLGNIIDHLSVEKRWEYGTSLDNEKHSFDLCEDCYKNIISKFKIPVEKE